MALVDRLAELREKTLESVQKANTTTSLDDVRISVLGKTGTLTTHLRLIGKTDMLSMSRSVGHGLSHSSGHCGSGLFFVGQYS